MSFPATHPALARALITRAYLEPTPVQAAVLQESAVERDLLVSAQTGSGKTVAYGLAMATTILGTAERFPRAAEPKALIIAPTRELAAQVHRELDWLYAVAGAQVVSCVGGMDARREQRALSAGCHIVVGTPGRLRDHLERGNLDVSLLQVVVLDEADEMLDLGFREDLEFILETTPAERRTLLFSATIAKEIAQLARRFQRDALRIDTIARNEPHGDIEYRAYTIAPNEIEHGVVNILRYFEVRAALVFCATREGVRHLHARLLERGFDAVALSGELSQHDRTTALQSLRDGRARVCVATDVAARGLDLPDLGLVIHVDLPTNRATLLHRSGRTGRAGRKGVSALLVPYTRRRVAERLLVSAGLAAAWSGAPTADAIRLRDQERLLADPVLTEPATDEDLAAARALLAGRSAEEIAAAFVRIHRARLPAPEDLFEVPAAQAPASRVPGQRSFEAREQRPAPGERFVSTGGPMVWFRMGVGRHKNADPKWLIPLICRLGHVTKKDIGAIRIFDRETKFEITQEAAGRFRAALAQLPPEEIRIDAADPAGPRPPHTGGKAPVTGKPKKHRHGPN
jgi:ATP-dependent RNA helicase DeaD